MNMPYVFFNSEIVRALRDRDEALRRERENLKNVAQRNFAATVRYLEQQNQDDYRGY